jgi:hypothetical protein
MPDVRTTNHIVSDLLVAALRGEWSGETNLACHCHPEHVSCCRECGALEEPHSNNNAAKRRAGQHEDGCALAKLHEEARAFLRAENALAEGRQDWDAMVYVP